VGRGGTTEPPSEHEAVWEAEGGAGARPGPIALPAGLRGKNKVLGWIVSAVVVALAVVVYFVSRPSSPLARSVAPPTWGSLTLAHVALVEAKAAGDPHPTHVTWLFTHRDQVLPVLSGTRTSAAEADYVVSMSGRFQALPGSGALPGSLPNGSRLILLVRAFDGTVTGWFLTDQVPSGLDQLGVVHTLSLGGL